jgi:hypothetical protein
LAPALPTTTEEVYSPSVALGTTAPSSEAPVLTTVTVASSPANPPPSGYVNPAATTTTTSVTVNEVVVDTFTYTITQMSYVQTSSVSHTYYLAFSTPLQTFYQMGYPYTLGSQKSGTVITATFGVSTAVSWANAAGFFATSAPPAGFYPNIAPPYTVSLFGPPPEGNFGVTTDVYFEPYTGAPPTPLYFYTITQTTSTWVPQTTTITLTGGGTEVVPVTTQVVSSVPPLLPAVWGVGVNGDATAYTDTTSSATSSTTYVVSGVFTPGLAINRPGSTISNVVNGVRTTTTESATIILTAAQYTQATGQTPNPNLSYFGYQITTTTQSVTASVVTTLGSQAEAISGVFVAPYVPSAAFAADHWGLPPAVGIVLPGESTGASGADLRLVGWVPA